MPSQQELDKMTKDVEDGIAELNKAIAKEWHQGEMMLGIFISAVGLIVGHVHAKGLACRHSWMPIALTVLVATPFCVMFLKRVFEIVRLKKKLRVRKQRLQHLKQIQSSAPQLSSRPSSLAPPLS
ncbi:hypothetical protein ACJRO7_004545 [Eucalyptus globulus]|uniref:Transmembrane protein n=1 Tax=Eucalyptus globulus TaxID=34317 RepID=A0ABD3IZR8_EUCGL